MPIVAAHAYGVRGEQGPLEGPSQGGRCPVCSTRIVVAGDGDIVVKNAILRVDRASGRVTAKCPRCKAWVDVPLRYVG